MLRFDRHDSRQLAPVSRKLRLKLWLLLGMLGLVGLMMRHLQQPKTIKNLGRLFSLQESSSDSEQPRSKESVELLDFAQVTAGDSPVVAVGGGETASEASDRTEKTNLEDGLPAKLTGVEDNAVFLNSETDAWLATLSEAQRNEASEIANASVGKLAYAQLVGQPDIYRGRVVTIHGTALREEKLKPTNNPLGIETYHRLIVAPEGGGEFPFFAYVLDLPEDFPHGERIRQRVVVHGYFFKNNSYATEQGMSVAPVIVAKAVQWEPQRKTATKREVSKGTPPWWAIAAVAVAVCLVVAVFHLNTRRKPANSKIRDDAALAELKQLADEEARE